jgi:transposase
MLGMNVALDAPDLLETIPGIGVIGATAIAASVPDAGVFKSGREFAAWIGLVPRQNSSGRKERRKHPVRTAAMLDL